MSTSADEAEGILEILRDSLGEDAVKARRMFGEYGLYLDGLFFGLICDGMLYIKPTAAGRAAMRNGTEARPYPKARLWLKPAADDLDDPEALAGLIRLTARDLR